MCQANLEVLDVYPFARSYPEGTGGPEVAHYKEHDTVHFKYIAMKPIDIFFWRLLSRQSTAFDKFNKLRIFLMNFSPIRQQKNGTTRITSGHIIVTSDHVTLCNITLHHITSYHIASRPVASYHIASRHVVRLRYITSYQVASRHVTSYHIALRHFVRSRYITSYHITSQ